MKTRSKAVGLVAALALVASGSALVAPGSAAAQTVSGKARHFPVLALVGAVTVAAIAGLALSGGGNEDEGPQSP